MILENLRQCLLVVRLFFAINALGAKITRDPKHNGVPGALLIFIKTTIMNTISCLNERQYMLSGNELYVPGFVEIMGVEMGIFAEPLPC